MTRSLDPAVLTLLSREALVPRDFLRVTARDRQTQAPVIVDFWSGQGNFTGNVLDPFTGLPEARTFLGAGSLIRVSQVRQTTGFAVQTVDIQMRQITEVAETSPEELLLVYDLRRAPVQLHRGFLDPDTRRLPSPAVPRFVGDVDTAPLRVGAADEEGGLTLRCTSYFQGLSRNNPTRRSGADQRSRFPGDAFYDDTAVAPLWDVAWEPRR